MMDNLQKKKVSDVLCDMGKYMVTVVPFSYFLSDKPDMLYVVIGMSVFGILVILLLILEICILESKNPLLKNIKLFRKK